MSNELLRVKDGMSFRLPTEYASHVRALALKYNTTNVSILCWIIRHFMETHEKQGTETVKEKRS